jgi:hypothetical protein
MRRFGVGVVPPSSALTFVLFMSALSTPEGVVTLRSPDGWITYVDSAGRVVEVEAASQSERS